VALVLAVDPDHAHNRTLARLTRELGDHEIVVAGSCDEALDAIDRRVPDLVILPLFLSATDEAALAARLRGLAGNHQPQALAIPLMACESSEDFAGPVRHDATPRWFYWFKPSGSDAPEIAPREFSAEVRACVERGRTSRRPPPPAPIAPPLVEAPPPAPVAAAQERPMPGGTLFRTLAESDSQDEPTTPAWQSALQRVRSLAASGVGALARIKPMIEERPDWLRISTYPRWLRYGTPSLVLAAGVTLTVGIPTRLPSWVSTTSAAVGTARMESVPDVNGKRLGVTPFDASLTAGTHLVEFRYHGVSRTVSLDVKAGANERLKVDWKKQPVARLVLTSEPDGANISIDGKPRGVAPLTIDDLSIGQHVVVFDHSGGSVTKTVKLKPNESTSVVGSIYSGWLTLYSPIELQISDEGQRITLDDKNRVMLSAGRHELQLSNRALGYRGTQIVDVQPGEFTTASVVLPKTTVSITATPGAEVWIDGVRVGETPLVNLPIELGTREIVLKHATLGERRVAATATVKPLKIDVDFTKPDA
jgi:CheY-like chemotaxis protein